MAKQNGDEYVTGTRIMFFITICAEFMQKKDTDVQHTGFAFLYRGNMRLEKISPTLKKGDYVTAIEWINAVWDDVGISHHAEVFIREKNGLNDWELNAMVRDCSNRKWHQCYLDQQNNWSG